MKLFKSLVFLIGLGFYASGAWAAQAAAGVAFDWSSLSVLAYALGPSAAPSVSRSGDSTGIHAETVSPTSFMTINAPNWTLSLLAGPVGNGVTVAGASADASGLNVLIGDSDQSAASIASANASRSASYAVTGSGLLVFSVNYTISALLQPGSLAPNYANAIAELLVVKGSVETKATDSINLASAGNVSRSGTLNLALLVQNGDVFSFSALAKAQAAVSEVPTPSALLLFGSAMLGFLGLNRRKMH